MKQDLVSIIVPVYNVERYLNRCIDSIVRQSYSNLEIILVDDGSTDNSSDICEEWKIKDNRITVIHKVNAGLGYARNTGLDYANGKFVFFVDSDDYIDINMVGDCIENASIYKSDVVLFGFNYADSNGRILRKATPCVEKLFYEDDEILRFVFPEMIYPEGKRLNLIMSASSGMYSLEVINRYKFRFFSEREYISEDTYSLMFLYKNIKKVSIIKNTFYYYCENPKSLTHRYRRDRYIRHIKMYNSYIQAIEQLGYSNIIRERIIYKHLGEIRSIIKIILLSDEKIHIKYDEIKRIVTDDHLYNIAKFIKKSRDVYTEIFRLLIYYKATSLVFILFYVRYKINEYIR